MRQLRKHLLAGSVASALAVAFSGQAQEAVDPPPDAIELPKGGSEAELLAQLADPATENWEQVERRLEDLWSRSGSVAMDLLRQRGEDALEDESFRAAVEHFTALIDHAPDFAAGYAGRAVAFFRMEEYGLAIDDISRTLALNPRHFESLMGLGVILEQLGEDEAALRAFEEAYALNPHRKTIVEGVERLKAEVVGRDA